MGSTKMVGLAAAAVLLLGCDRDARKRDQPGPPVRLAFGDCAGPAAAFVVGPKPAAFEHAQVEAHMAGLQPTPSPPPADAGAAEPSTRSGGDPGDLEPGDRGMSEVDGLGDRDDAPDFGFLDGQVGVMHGGFGHGLSGGGGGGFGMTGVGPGSTGAPGAAGRIGIADIGRGSADAQSGYGSNHMLARPPRPLRVLIGKAEVRGELDAGLIRRFMRRNLVEFRTCYQEQLVVDPGLRGRLVVDFTISPEGEVTSVKASGLGEPVEGCVANVIRAIRFPKPKSGGQVQVHYPLVFEPPEGPPATAAVSTPPPDAAVAPAEPPPVPYQPGAANPLGAHAVGVQACLRGAAPGAGVVELTVGPDGAVTSSQAFDVGGDEAAACIAEVARQVRWPEGAGAVHRCSIAFGDLSPGDARGVDLTAEAVSFAGARVADTGGLVADEREDGKVEALYTQLRDQAARIERPPERVVTPLGPVILRPADTVPMRAVYAVARTLVAADVPWLLAAEGDAGWRLLDEVALPVVPIPLGTGAEWRAYGRPPGLDGIDGNQRVELSVLVEDGEVSIGLSRVNQAVRIASVDGEVDWPKVEAALKDYKAEHFADRDSIDLAGLDRVPYGQVVRAIDAARAAGFTDWKLVRPDELLARWALAR
jgi:hypothetical protein